MSNPRFQEAVQHLNQGRLQQGKQILEDIILDDPTNPAILYNLGMCYSDLNQLDAAIRTLEKAVEYDPLNADILTALGVAYARNSDFDNAERYIKKSLGLDPENPYALRNFGALFLQKQEYDKALYYLKQSFDLLPNDPQTLFGLAQSYEHFGDYQIADDYYKAVVDSNAPDPIKNLARTARSELAQKSSHAIGFQTDAMFYLINALEYFQDKDMRHIREVTYEIGLLGRNGFELDNPQTKYTLKSMPGSFSGLNLLCFMYVGFRKIDPSQDIQIDFSREYAAALTIHYYKKDE